MVFFDCEKVVSADTNKNGVKNLYFKHITGFLLNCDKINKWSLFERRDDSYKISW